MADMPVVQRPKNARQGKRTGKFGRKKSRSLAQSRYTSERRWEKNKRNKAQKRANKYGHPVKIKIQGEWVTIRKSD